MSQLIRVGAILAFISSMLVLSGCDDQSSSASSSGGGTAAVAPSSSSAATLSISGTPSATIAVGSKYSFSPKVNAASGETLKFSITNMPEWASFDESSGLLSGIPIASNVGKSSSITISVSGSAGSAKLAPFVITVNGGAAVANITWASSEAELNIPADMKLAGFHIYYGTTPTALTHEANVDDPTLTNYVVKNLASGMWYFSVSAYNAEDVESARSPTIAAML